MKEPTHLERLAVIEAIALRIEQKLDHFDKRIRYLEKAFAYAGGIFSAAVTGLGIWVKVRFTK